MWQLTSRIDYNLAELLDKSTNFNTLLASDKVYACLGLWKASQYYDTSEKAQESLHVDYDQDRDALYATATHTAILEDAGEHDELHLLELASSLVPPRSEDAEIHSGSSWIPRLDWSFDKSQGSARSVGGFGKGAADKMSHESVQSTVGIEKDSKQNFVLGVSGVVVDKVSEVSSIIENGSAYDELAKEVYQCRKIALRLADEYAFALTMTCGKDSSRNVVANSDSFWELYAEFLAAHAEVVSEQSHSSEPDDGRYDEGFSILHAKGPNDSWRYIQLVSQESGNRRFFVTSTGFIGMGPRTMKDSDQVCILLGGISPFVLRADGDYWKLIGDAYVAGIMEGEYIRQLKNDGLFETELRRFKIR